jgi:hypothetical protein
MALSTIPVQCGPLAVRKYSWRDWPEIAPVWAALFDPDCFSIFVSDRWVATWMEVFGPSVQPSILLFADGKDVQGACLLVHSKRTFGPVMIRRVSLNTSGEAVSEATYPEFNDILCRRGARDAVVKSLAGYLVRAQWDELILDGYERGTGFDALQTELVDLDWEVDPRPSYYVDLSTIRQSQSDFEAGLGRTSRKHLRQNRRNFSETGRLLLEHADTAPAALSLFDEMSVLNRRRRDGKGYGSAFAADRFVEFHRRLIRRFQPDRSVRLARLSASGRTLGILYLLHQCGKIYFYQCGFEINGGRWSPGTLTVAEYIQHCLDCGLNEFDFLAGREAYKERLSTGSRILQWARGHRPGAKMRAVEAIRRVAARTNR